MTANRKILVIDDQPENLLILRKILTEENFVVISAADGESGVDKALADIPDLIICDIMMPGMSGFDVLKILHENPKTMLIPFVFLSAKSEMQDIREGMKLGADDYIPKPVRRNELLNVVNVRLAKKENYEKKLNELRRSISFSLPHELKTPLVSILGFSQIIKNDIASLQDNEVSDMAEIIYKSANNLNRLIQKILFYIKLELLQLDAAQYQIFTSGSVEVNNSLVYNFSVNIARQYNRENDLYIDMKESVLKISEPNLKTILTELIDNAFKFSSPGSEVKISGSCSENNFMLSILNHGHGLTDEQIAFLGGYFQADRMLYEQPGLGLGIPIAKKIAEFHSGKFKIESIPGKETLITLFLPLSEII